MTAHDTHRSHRLRIEETDFEKKEEVENTHKTPSNAFSINFVQKQEFILFYAINNISLDFQHLHYFYISRPNKIKIRTDLSSRYNRIIGSIRINWYRAENVKL